MIGIVRGTVDQQMAHAASTKQSGFDVAGIGVVRDNARQLKFRAESTGFE